MTVEDRPGLAAERTTLAWRRTGMSAVIAGGFVAKGMSGGRRPFGYGLALLLVAIGTGVMLVGRHGGETGLEPAARRHVPLLARAVAVVAWCVALVTVLPLDDG